jgi:hypothetical protein
MGIYQLIGDSSGPPPEPFFVMDGATLAAPTDFEGVTLFDTETMETVGVLPARGATFSPSGDLIATPRQPSGISLLTADGSAVTERAGSYAAVRLIFSPDGSRIYAAPEASGVLTVWGVPWEP